MSDVQSQALVSQILDRHRGEIVREFDAIGSGVGKRDHAYVIVVYLRVPRRAPTEPVFIEGIPVDFVVTGEIKKH